MWRLGVAALPVGVALLIHGILPPSAVPGAVGLLASLVALLALPPRVLCEVAADQANRLAAALVFLLPQAVLLPGLGVEVAAVVAVMTSAIRAAGRSAKDRARIIAAHMYQQVGAPDLTIHPRLASTLVRSALFAA
jgi:hypothetical protein